MLNTYIYTGLRSKNHQKRVYLDLCAHVCVCVCVCVSVRACVRRSEHHHNHICVYVWSCIC